MRYKLKTYEAFRKAGLLLFAGLLLAGAANIAKGADGSKKSQLAEKAKEINGSKPEDRIKAIEDMGRITGRDNIKEVNKALCDRFAKEKDTRVKSYLVDSLVLNRSEEGAKLILDALTAEKKRNLRLEMINAIGALKYEAGSAVLKTLLRSDDGLEKLYSAYSLAEMGDDSGIEVLKAVAVDKNETTGKRAMAVRALGNIKNEESADVLETVLSDNDAVMRLQAVSTLISMGGKRAEGLIKKAEKDKDENVRGLAANFAKGKK